MTSMRYCSGPCAILFAVGLASCVATEDDIEDLGTLGDGKSDTLLPRTVEVELAPNTSKRFRITTPAFVASLEQVEAVAAQLTAKHFEIAFASDVSATPQLTAVADGSVRNWTLTVFNRGDATLDATVVIDVPRASGELGIVSDIDKTVLPPATTDGLPPPYPGIASLLRTLELRAGGLAGDVHFVTARTPDGVVGIPEWMALHDVPAGPIDTGISGVPFVAQREKVADITRIFDATLDQPYVLFGDSSHRDPEVYREVVAKFPGRVAAVFINKVTATVSPDRVTGMHLVNNYAEAAAIAFGLELITEDEARSVMNDAQAEGLAITPAEIDALVEANR
jgi:hypothetical protein